MALLGHKRATPSPERIRIRPRRSYALLCCLAALLITAFAFPVQAQAPGVEEYKVKAAFLYSFTKFVQWPNNGVRDGRVNFALGILGDDPFGRSIDAVVKGKTFNGHPIGIKKSHKLEDLRDCHILFISAAENRRMGQHLGALNGTPALTVSDAEGFARQGGMIELFLENNRVRLAVNRKAIERAGLTVSSKLLSLARIVEEDRPRAGAR